MTKNNHHIDFSSQYKSLSILFNSDGFSFSISDIETNKTIVFSKYLFEKTISAPEFLLSEILRIFANDKNLQQDFETIEVIHQNELSTLVPIPYFDETKLKTYLDYNIKTLPNDYITYDKITQVGAMNVYIPYVNINNYLLQNFGEFNFKHYSTILIEKLIQHNNGFFVYVSERYLDIVVIKDEKLQLYNSFEYQTPQDFIYYILFVTEQLELHPEEFQLTFLGDIKTTDENYIITYKYIRNIDFITTTSDFFSTSDDFTNHSNYILVS